MNGDVLDLTTTGCYFLDAFHVRRLIRLARLTLAGVEFDTLVGTGNSGALVLAPLARAFGVRYAVVRKKNDHGHSGRVVEGYFGRRWLFVDDIVDSGHTQRHVKRAIKHTAACYDWETTYVGTYEYMYQRLSDAGDQPRWLVKQEDGSFELFTWSVTGKLGLRKVVPLTT